MILLADIGNSRIKWACLAVGEIVEQGAMPHAELALWQPTWAKSPEAAVVSCVAEECLFAALKEKLGLPSERVHRLISARSAHGILNEYDDPAQLGSDRYAALVAAHRRGLGDCVVAGAGTAMTVDMLTAEGRFLGGCIVPGPGLMRASLASATAQVAVAEGVAGLFPRDTRAGVATGIALALCGVVEGICRRFEAESGQVPNLIVAGGARAWLMPCLGRPAVEVENLVLEGLAWIARDLGYVA